jgi:hypothetical protein
MSWSASTPVVEKHKVEEALDNLVFSLELDGPALDQVSAAKRAALELIKTIPGPKIRVSLSGHANGMGWQSKEGWSDDCIHINVCQVVKEYS